VLATELELELELELGLGLGPQFGFGLRLAPGGAAVLDSPVAAVSLAVMAMPAERLQHVVDWRRPLGVSPPVLLALQDD